MVHEFFGEEQYALERAGVQLRAEPGDVVVGRRRGLGRDGALLRRRGRAGRAACWRSSSRPTISVFGREPGPEPRLRDRVEIVPRPLWDAAGQPLRFDEAGGQTSVAGSGAQEVLTETIDARRRRRAVDFIKLDVEGAEMAALRGAEQTIRAHRPKLALSVYHSVGDMADIPAWVDGLGLGYRLYLDHRWPGPAETILFAHVREVR